MNRASVAVLALMSCAPAPPPTDARDPDLDALILALADDDLAERDRATTALMERGPAAAGRVLRLMHSEDPEVRARALQIVARLIDHDSYLPLVAGAEWRYRLTPPQADAVVRCGPPAKLPQACYPGLPNIEDYMWRRIETRELRGLLGQTMRARRFDDVVVLGAHWPADEEYFRTLLRLDWRPPEACEILGETVAATRDRVTVPAGTFDCLHVPAKDVEWWLARGVGIVKVRHGFVTWELAAFKFY